MILLYSLKKWYYYIKFINKSSCQIFIYLLLYDDDITYKYIKQVIIK